MHKDPSDSIFTTFRRAAGDAWRDLLIHYIRTPTGKAKMLGAILIPFGFVALVAWEMREKHRENKATDAT